MFSAKNYERTLLDELNAGHRHELVYFDTLLGPCTTSLAAGFPAVSVFVNDLVDAHVLKALAAGGTFASAGAALASVTSMLIADDVLVMPSLT